MAITCSKWERLIEKAEREGNKGKSLEFREKLVECIVYMRRGGLSPGGVGQ